MLIHRTTEKGGGRILRFILLSNYYHFPLKSPPTHKGDRADYYNSSDMLNNISKTKTKLAILETTSMTTSDPAALALVGLQHARNAR